MRSWIERHRALVDYSVNSLMRRKARNMSLWLVYSAVVFVLASVMLFTHALRQEANAVLTGAPEITVQNIVMGRHALIPETDIEALSNIRGARNARGRLWGYFYDTANGANYTLMVPKASEAPEAGHVKIGNGIATSRNLAVGKYLFLMTPRGTLFKLKVSEIFSHTSDLVAADLVMMADRDYRDFFQIPEGIFTDLVLNVRNEREVTKIAEKISAALPNSRVITRNDILRTYDSLFSWREGILLAVLAGGLFAFVIFAWDKASGLSADERREIGILKAVGWDSADILSLKIWEGLLVSLGAFLFGYLIAYVHVFFFAASLFEPVLKGWAVLYPDIELTPVVDPLQVTTLLFFSVVPFVAATLVPIWRAAITDPDQVMR